MSREPNKFVIGLFVLGGVGILLSGVVLLGSGILFRKARSYVTFFEGSVKGLTAGAPVLFRGVHVGEIKQVILQVDHGKEEVKIPVVFDIYPQSLMEVGKRPTRDSTVITRMIEQGLRTRLELQSVVTGVLAVNLDFYPETPVRFVGEMEQLIEIPSIPSAIDVLSDALGDVPVQEIVGEFRTTMRQLKKFLSSKELNEIPTEVALTLKEVRDTARATNRLLVSSEELLMPLKSEARGVSDSLKEALSSFAKANREASILLGDDSKVISQIEVTLEEVNKGARAIYELLRFLERHPDALIKGKR